MLLLLLSSIPPVHGEKMDKNSAKHIEMLKYRFIEILHIKLFNLGLLYFMP